MFVLRHHSRWVHYFLGVMLCSCLTHAMQAAITFRNPDGSEVRFNKDDHAAFKHYIQNTVFAYLLNTPMFLEDIKIKAHKELEAYIQDEFKKPQANNNSFVQHNSTILTKLKRPKRLSFLYPTHFPRNNIPNRDESKVDLKKLSADILAMIDVNAVHNNPAFKSKLQDIFYDYCLRAYHALHDTSEQGQDPQRDKGFEWLVTAQNLPDVLYTSITLTPNPNPSRYNQPPVVQGSSIPNQEFDIITDRYLIESKFSLGQRSTWYKIFEQASREFAWILICQELVKIDQFTVPALTQQDTMYHLPIPASLGQSQQQYLTSNLVTRNNPHLKSRPEPAFMTWYNLIYSMIQKPLCIYTQYNSQARAFCQALQDEDGIRITSQSHQFIRGLHLQLRFIDHSDVYHIWYDARSSHLYGKRVE